MSRLPPLSQEEKARLAEVCLSAIEVVLARGEMPLFVQFLTNRGGTSGPTSLPLCREAKPPSGEVAKHASTAHAEEAIAPSRVAKRQVKTPCAEAIRRMFAETGRRMTGGEVKHWLEDHGHKFGDSTVEHTLSDMSTKTHELNNRKGSHGKGYGLAEWS